jgi:SAM-dependent methyltransferase
MAEAAGIDLHDGEWLDANRAQWDERVPLHLESEFYDVDALKAGTAVLYPIEEEELPLVAPDGLAGLRVLHLQCHFGADSLILAQRGAEVVGLDFSKPAVLAARELASELGLNARFVHANVYDARHVLPEPESFDIVYTTWGTIGWLPDVAEWARIVAWYLKPGGRLYFADGHPAAWVFDGLAENGMPEWKYPYDTDGVADIVEDASTYVDDSIETAATKTFEWQHPVSETVTALLDAGLTIDALHEHYELPFRMFESLVPTRPRMFGWADKKWMPLGWSIAATRRGSS